MADQAYFISPDLIRAASVSCGRFGDIKKLMRQLSKRNSFLDLEFVCTDGSLFGHKFVIGAQSRYLRQIMLSCDDDICRIHVPDVPKAHMEIVLKFLYTGRLGITAAVKNIVKDLLEEILRVDAKINLPPDEAMEAAAAAAAKKGGPDRNGKRDGDGEGSPESSSPKRGRFEGDAASPSQNPPDAQSSHSYTHGASSYQRQQPTNYSSYSSPYDALPLSPPHILDAIDTGGDDVDGVVVLGPPTPKPSPPLIELSDSDDDDPTIPETDQSTSAGTLFVKDEVVDHIIEPEVLSSSVFISGEADDGSHSSFQLPPTDVQAANESVFISGDKEMEFSVAIDSENIEIIEHHPEAVVVHSPEVAVTNEPVFISCEDKDNLSQSGLDSAETISSSQAVAQIFVPDDIDSAWTSNSSEIPSVPVIVSKSTGGSTRGSRGRGRRGRRGGARRFMITRASSRLSGTLSPEVGQQQLPDESQIIPTPEMSFQNYFPMDFPPNPLPPPFPLPPREGMVISRGRWVEGSRPLRRRGSSGRGQINSHISSTSGTSSSNIRKHHFSPYTITGRMMPSTLLTLSEPEGVHPCEQCPLKFNKRASLEKHIGRAHNPRLTVKCPECPKLLSNKTAIKKHLLSHRPEEEWPFICPFCSKRFQAKGDLPKHFNTSKHKDDVRIPQMGTPEWTYILNVACVVLPQNVSGLLKKKKKARTMTTSATRTVSVDVKPELPSVSLNPQPHFEPDFENTQLQLNTNSVLIDRGNISLDVGPSPPPMASSSSATLFHRVPPDSENRPTTASYGSLFNIDQLLAPTTQSMPSQEEAFKTSLIKRDYDGYYDNESFS